jgi:hypothetical protein
MTISPTSVGEFYQKGGYDESFRTRSHGDPRLDISIDDSLDDVVFVMKAGTIYREKD